MQRPLDGIARLQRTTRRLAQLVVRTRGNTMLYVLLVMVIFGVLGATMVSLFTSSTAGSAALNEDRRARYLCESAARYAETEMRNSNFASSRIDELNTTTYTLGQAGTFQFDIYSLWFRSDVSVNLPLGDPLLRLNLEEGEIPDEVANAIPNGNIYVVNMESTEADISGNLLIPASSPGSTAIVNGFFKDSPTTYRVAITDASDNTFSVDTDERVCFAVRPTGSQSPSAHQWLDVHEDARFIFPRFNGVVFIKTEPVLYEEAIPEPGSHVRLTNLSAAVDVDTGDYVILWPANHTIIPSASTGNVSCGGDTNYTVNVVDTGDLTLGKYGAAKEDIDAEEFVQDLTAKESGPTNLIERDLANKSLSIGDGTGLSSDAFGGAWYDADKSVGGVSDFCDTGRCRFGIGIRAFFTLTYTGTGDGFIFSIVNGANNDVNSIGGDIQASELLGYAGDSRLVANPTAATDFLDNGGWGLQPPKIGLEFDTRINFDDAFEQTQDYCSVNLTDTRNDPLASGKDAVQYVFWGRDTLDIPCRTSSGQGTYDDNRHDAVGAGSENWNFSIGGDVVSGPVVDTDGTIYVGPNYGTLFAVNPDGSQKWRFDDPNGQLTDAVIGPTGTVYVGSGDNFLYALNPSDGSDIFRINTFAPITTKPAVDGSGFIYVSSGSFVFKIDPSVPAIIGQYSPAANPSVRSAPVLNSDGSRIYAIFNDDQLYAIASATLTEVWHRPASGSVGSPAVHPSTGDIYVSANTGVTRWNSAGSFQGSFGLGSSVSTGPTLSRDGNTLYVGYTTGRLVARTAAGLGPKWIYATLGSQPIAARPQIDANEHIYFGANDNNVYALFSDGTLKWEAPFPTGNDVRTTPAIDGNGTVYAGSDDNRLYAINQFAGPRNYRQNFTNPTTAELGRNLVAYSAAEAVEPYPDTFVPTDSEDWLQSGPWAVRMEITRDPASGDYLLRTWVRQCTTGDCNDVLGTFFEDTRVAYDPGTNPAPNLEQSFNLGGSLNTDFTTFLFGFTSAGTTGDDQVATIENFQLSFIRPNDPVVDDPLFQ